MTMDEFDNVKKRLVEMLHGGNLDPETTYLTFWVDVDGNLKWEVEERK